MKVIPLLLLSCCLPFCSLAQKSKKKAKQQPAKLESPFQVFFEPREVEVKSDQNSICSITQDGIYLKRVVDLSTGKQSALLVYKDSTFEVQEGQAFFLWHNEQVRAIGMYKDNQAHGNWQYFTEKGILEREGFYAMGQKGGPWKYYHYNSEVLESRFFFQNGTLNGPFQVYNEQAELIQEGQFRKDSLISASDPSLQFFFPSGDTIMPRFTGCDASLSGEELRKCSEEKMLQFIFENLRSPGIYPPEEGGGSFVLEFSIAPSGKLFNLKVASSSNPKINQSTLDAVRAMPDWVPGSIQDRPIEVSLKLPFSISTYTVPLDEKE